MIQYIIGVPGSGKSYYGIFNIAIHFAKDLRDNKKFKSYFLSKTKYKVCLTNLNELKYDKFDNVKPINFDDFKDDLVLLHSAYQSGYTDTQLADLIKDKDFFNALIVLDECHNYLNEDDEVLIWWLSYHRHFYQDIILITQDLPLVNKKYKSFTEFYYKAIPSSRKLFNFNMIYHQYTGHQLYKTQKAVTKKLPIIKEIFSLYGSGENNKQKSLILHFLTLGFIVFLLALVFGYYYFNYVMLKDIDNDIKKDTSNDVIQEVSNSTNINKPLALNDDLEVYIMMCTDSICEINSNYYEIEFIERIFLDYYKPTIIAKTGNKVYLLLKDEFNLFTNKSYKGAKNEDSNSINVINELFKSTNK